MNSPLAVAILGAGHGHSNLYIPALLSEPGTRVVAIAEADDEQRVYRASQIPGVAAYRDAEELLRRETSLDLLIVMGEHRLMAEGARTAIEAGVPFLLEKPGGLTLNDVRAVRDAAALAGVPVVVPFIQRFGPLAEMAGLVGDVRHASLEFFAGYPERYRAGGNSWMLDPSRSGGGVMLNLGVHMIDAFLFFAASGSPVDVGGAVLRSFEQGLAVDDFFSATLSTADAVGHVSASYTYPSMTGRHVAYELVGTEGFAVMRTDGTTDVVTGGHSRTLRLDPDSDAYYAPFIRRVVRSYSTGFADLPGLDDLVAVREVTDRVPTTPPRLGTRSAPDTTR